MIVDCAVYHEGQRHDRPADLRSAVEAARAAGDFVWIGLFEPSREELERVADEFGLHPLAVEDAVKAHQRPKLERYGEGLFLVLKTLRYIDETSDVESGEVALFLGEAYVVTVRHGLANPLSDVRHRLEQERRDLLTSGPTAVLYAVCDAVVDTYTFIAQELEQDIEEVEARVFSPQLTHDAEVLYKLKREVLEFRRAARPLIEPMSRLAQGWEPAVAVETRPFFRDIADHLVRSVEQLDGFDSQLTDILTANLAQVSVRQNADMRRISAWVAMAAVPTMIAGIYGMNFEHMPELGWRYGYPLIMGIIAVTLILMYRAFKRSGWL